MRNFSLCVLRGFLCVGISLPLMGFSSVQPSNVKDVLVPWRRTRRVGFMSLENGSVGYLVGYLEAMLLRLCALSSHNGVDMAQRGCWHRTRLS